MVKKMKIDIFPSKVQGEIRPPASKSFLHRAIISACLACGHSRINNIVLSDDVLATVNAFKTLGVNIEVNKDSFDIYSKGFDGFTRNVDIDCNESGSTIRFLIPILSNTNFAYFKGKSSLISRPFNIYETIFKDRDLIFKKTSNTITTKGGLSPGNYIVPGDISSQFISGLLFVLPLLDGDSTIKITKNFESRRYVEMTVNILKSFGVKVRYSDRTFYIPGNQKYLPNTVNSEIDYSQMAFFAVLGIVNNDIKITDINYDSLQPDIKIIDIILNSQLCLIDKITGNDFKNIRYVFRKYENNIKAMKINEDIIDIIRSMGGNIKTDNKSITFCKSQTSGIEIDVSQCPDIAPILGVLGAVSNGVTNIVNAKRLTMKESNRLLSTFNQRPFPSMMMAM